MIGSLLRENLFSPGIRSYNTATIDNYLNLHVLLDAQQVKYHHLMVQSPAFRNLISHCSDLHTNHYL